MKPSTETQSTRLAKRLQLSDYDAIALSDILMCYLPTYKRQELYELIYKGEQYPFTPSPNVPAQHG